MRGAVLLSFLVGWAAATGGRTAHAATPEDVARTAEHYLGVPYNWGGTSADGFDCSGFIGKVYAENGYVLPRVSYQQARVGLVVPEFALQKGDLLFFTSAPGGGPVNHVAMFLQKGAFIHASVGRNAVAFDSMQSRYFRHRFAGARRILGLPPGRYATLAGTAPEGLLFADVSGRNRFAALPASERARVVGASPASGPLPAMAGEHSLEDRPWQIAAQPPVAVAVTEVGPTRLGRGRTGLGVQGGTLRVNRDNFAFVQPEFRYVGEATSIRIDVAVPWAVPWESGVPNPMAWGPWTAARTWGRMIRTLGIGQAHANLEVHLDRTWSATLGGGQLMRYLTPNIGTAGLADTQVEHSALTFAGSTTQATFGAQWVVDDVFAPAVLGARAWLGPALGSVGSHGLWGATGLSLSWAADLLAPATDAVSKRAQTRQVHGLGVTLDTSWYKSPSQSFSSMLDASTLLHPRAHGWGVGAALTWEGRGFGMSELRGRLRWEGRASQGAFVPTYFDVLYAASRAFAPVQPAPVRPAGAVPPSRLDWLDSLRGAPWHWSMAAEGHLQMFHRATIGIAYEDGESLSNAFGTYSPRSVMLFLRLDPIAQDPRGDSSGLYVAYHLRNVDALSEAGWRAYWYVAARHDIHRYVGLQAAVRRGLQTHSLQVETDFMGSLSVQFDL